LNNGNGPDLENLTRIASGQDPDVAGLLDLLLSGRQLFSRAGHLRRQQREQKDGNE